MSSSNATTTPDIDTPYDPMVEVAATRGIVRIARPDRPVMSGRLLFWPRPGSHPDGTRARRAKVELPSGAIIGVNPDHIQPLDPTAPDTAESSR